MAEDFCDLTRLIRSIQRLEGNPDCFGAAGDCCEQLACAWRKYCLKPSGALLVAGTEKVPHATATVMRSTGIEPRRKKGLRQER